MSKSSKSSRSGLATLKRDFNDVKPPNSSPEEPIPWEPTQRPAASSQKLTPAEIRLRAITAALQSLPSTSAPAPPLAASKVQNKRPSNDVEPPAKRPRQLPSSWDSRPSAPKTLFPTSASSSSMSQHVKGATTSTDALPPRSKKVAAVFLSQEQTYILKLVESGDSIFYTGSAGTGKSVLLREIIKVLKKKFVKSPDAVAVTASTGIAACNIGGVTVHSFAGIGLGAEPAEELLKKIKKNKKTLSRWMRTKVLIIDEVSMLDGVLFDKLAKIASIIRGSPQPFGGIQIIVTGDFFQLPPVGKNDVATKFAFEAEAWPKVLNHTFNLTKVFRQSDQTFVNMLNEMRFGNLSQESIRMFKKLDREVVYDDGIMPTELFPRRDEVDRSNWARMSGLSSEEQIFIASDSGSQDPAARERFLANCMAPQKLTLRTDAQVMLIKNMDDTLVNGTTGKIVCFKDIVSYTQEGHSEGEVIGAAPAVAAYKKKDATGPVKTFPVVDFSLPNGYKRRMLVLPEQWKSELPNGDIQASRMQLPLILSWAMSIHKSQGQTLDRVKVDLGKVFEKGQAYVALSRATSLDRLQVLNFDPAKVKVHPRVVEWSKTLSTIDDVA